MFDQAFSQILLKRQRIHKQSIEIVSVPKRFGTHEKHPNSTETSSPSPLPGDLGRPEEQGVDPALQRRDAFDLRKLTPGRATAVGLVGRRPAPAAQMHSRPEEKCLTHGFSEC